MEDPSHFLTGMLIAKLTNLILPSLHVAIQIIIIVIFSFLSHFIVDALADLTYHTSDPRPEDKFWLSRKIFYVVLTWAFVLVFFVNYWYIMAVSVLPDIIDWFILRRFFKKEPIIHPYVNKFRKKFFSWLPYLRETKWASINEIIFMIILGIFVWI